MRNISVLAGNSLAVFTFMEDSIICTSDFIQIHTVCPINFILQCNKCQSTCALLADYECFRSRSGFLSSLIFREKQSSFENEFRDSFSAFYVDFIGNFWKRGESRLCGLSENYALGC